MKTSPPFFVDHQQIKDTGEVYTCHLNNDLLPACSDLYPDNDFIFVLDGTPSHTSNVCQKYLREELGTRFVDKKSWPPKSPDCNHLVYYFWDALSEEVYKDNRCVPFTSLEELKNKVLEVWQELSRRLITRRKAIAQFFKRLREVV